MPRKTPAKKPRRKATRRAPSKPAKKPRAGANTKRLRAVSPPLQARDTPALAPLLRLATAGEAKFLAELVGKAKSPPRNVEALEKLCTNRAQRETLATVVERVRAKAEAAGQAHRERARARSSALSAADREIGPLPDVEDPDRKESCRFNFQLFCETYLRRWFFFAWSDEQLTVIKRIERAVLNGGLFAVAMPRGGGKTALCRAAVLWAILFAHHTYVMLVCASDDKYVEEGRAAIKTALETFPLLLADFPETCYPIHALEGIHNRCKGQTLDGEPTRMSWKEKGRLILPTVEGSASSAAVIGGGGLKAGTIRGSNFTTADGELRRPSLVIVDDPQTDESAGSTLKCAKLERLISQAILGMAGPDGKIAVLMPCTVIQRGDVADRLLDREKHPRWKGHRTAMLQSWPERMDLWDQYWDLCCAELKGNADLEEEDIDPCPQGTQFVRDNFDEMHRSAKASWESRKRPYHLSAVQQAMDLYYGDRIGFFSEYQNWLMTAGSPSDPTSSEDLHLDADKLAVKWSGHARGVLPPPASFVTAFIDCHDRALYWVLCAWGTDFTGWVLDYGTFPETRRQTFYVGTFSPTLQSKFPGTGLEGALHAGLDALTETLLNARYRRTDGAELPVNLCLIDTGYQTKTVRNFIDGSRFVGRLQSSFGKALGPDETPFSAYKQRAGERIGDDWLIRKAQRSAHRSQHVVFEANNWKTFAARRLLTEIGDPGSLSFYGVKGKDQPHWFFARHMSAEHAKEEDGRQRKQTWTRRPGETENHWFDGVVGNCVAASILGVKLGGAGAVGRRRLSLRELQQRRKRDRGA